MSHAKTLWRGAALVGLVTAYKKRRQRNQTDAISMPLTSVIIPGLERRLDRIQTWIFGSFDRIIKGNVESLIPSQKDLGFGYQVPCLVLDPNDLLGDYIYRPSVGWSFAECLGAREFHSTLSQCYEIVIWTRDHSPVGQKLSVEMQIPVSGVLNRNDCRLTGLRHPRWDRPIQRLGRPPQLTLVVDSCKRKIDYNEPVALQDSSGFNTVLLEYGDTASLLGLMKFLRREAESHKAKCLANRGSDVVQTDLGQALQRITRNELVTQGEQVLRRQARGSTMTSWMRWITGAGNVA